MSQFGEEIIGLTWEIRKDVQQACQGRLIFDDIRKDKNNPDEFNQQKIYEIIHGGQDHNDKNAKFQFETYDEIAQYINGMNCRIDVDVSTSNSGKKFNRIKFGGYHPSQAKGQSLPDGVVAVGNADGLTDGSDELPF
jgi:hypothetical protein